MSQEIHGRTRRGSYWKPMEEMEVRGWSNYFRHGASSKTFAYLGAFSWRRVWRWLCKKHPRRPRKELVRRYYQNWRPVEDEVTLCNPAAVAISRYRYRSGGIPSPWKAKTTEPDR